MRQNLPRRFLSFQSDNRKSKIENLKWLGLSVFAFMLVVCGAVAEAQQPKKVHRIGFLSASDAARESIPFRGNSAGSARAVGT